MGIGDTAQVLCWAKFVCGNVYFGNAGFLVRNLSSTTLHVSELLGKRDLKVTIVTYRGVKVPNH